jgi:hypothetical protein
MTRALKILKWIFVSMLSLSLIAFGYLYFIYFSPPEEVSEISQVNDRAWRRLSLGGKSLCSDGSEFAIFVKKGKSDNLVIHFSGGGGCWDNITCAHPISLLDLFDDSRDLQSFYISSLSRIIPKILTGLNDSENTSNAFHDWHMVFIPYCTGDLHIGNVTNTYTWEGETFQVHHNGRNNTLAALAWVFSNFKNPGKVLVSGESAGAYASASWTPYVADHYPNKKIYQLSDGALLQSLRWKEILDTVWQSESTSFLHFNISKDIFEDALLHRNDSTSRQIKYLHSNTLYDQVLPRFSAVLNHQSTQSDEFINNWSTDTRKSMKRLEDSDLDYHYFISDCSYDPVKHYTPHTLTNVQYYSCKIDQLSFADWLKKNVIEDVSLSVGGRFLESGGK